MQTGVKSFGWLNSTAQPSPIQSWKLIGPAVVSAVKSGAVSLSRRPHPLGSPRRGAGIRYLRSTGKFQNFCFSNWSFVRRLSFADGAQIGDALGVSHHTVKDTRAELEGTGQIPQLDRTTGADGKSRPARKPTNPVPIIDLKGRDSSVFRNRPISAPRSTPWLPAHCPR